MNNRRSASVGALPVEKKHFVSRNESASGVLLDVRCACQYFQCESLLPERANPVESRPTSKQGFVSEMEHFDNMSSKSFNMMSRQMEFDRMSAASFGGRMQGMEGRGLIVRSISDATEQEMIGGMMAGHRGRQMSIGGMSSGSFGGRDPDAVSIRSGISIRRISRSPSHADLFVADLNIPTPHFPGQSRRGSKGEIPKLNIVAPTPTPGIGNVSPPDFSIYDRKTRAQQSRRMDDNKENILGHHDRLLPQNKPIDVSKYADRDEYGRIINEQMDVDIEAIEPVVDIKDNIRIDRMSPPLQENVPDISPVVEDETRIEITDFAPQPDLRPIEEILADDKPPARFDGSNGLGPYSTRQISSPSLSQLKRQHAHERDLSPDYSKKQFMQRGSPTGAQSFQRASSPAPGGVQHMDTGMQHMNTRQYGSSPTGAQSFQRESSPAPASKHHTDTRQFLTSAQSFHRGSSPAPEKTQHVDAKQFMHYGSSPTGTQPFQRASSPAPTSMPHTDTRQYLQTGSSPAVSASQSFHRASSPVPTGVQHMETSFKPTIMDSQVFQRASSPSPTGMQPMDTSQSFQRASSPVSVTTQQFMQRGSPSTAIQSSQRASSPMPSKIQHLEGRQFMQRGSPPAGHYMETPKPIDKPHEDKQSYSSRFMSMFHSKTPEHAAKLDTPPQDKRKLSVSKLLHIDRGRSPSPGRQLKPEPSPTPSRLMSVFKREKLEHPTAMSVVEGSHVANVSIRKAPEEKPHTVKVTETFSLKVDEMDQYTSRPPKSPSPIRHSHLYASSEQLVLTQDRLSESVDFYGDRQEAFAPIIVSTTRSSQMQLQAGDRSHYMFSSQSDIRPSRRFGSHEHIPHPITFGSNKKLVSVPIAFDSYDSEMTTTEFIHEEFEEQKNDSRTPYSRANIIKAPSEQRLAQSKLLQRKAYTSDRTQSQDRAAADRASELDSLSISTRSMSKTVSFNFGEHGSRLSEHEKIVSSNNQLDNKHWLERTYFSR